MLHKIIVPLDGSAFGEHALPLAVTLARRAEARLQLVHVHQALEPSYAEMQLIDDTLDAEMRTRERAYLQAVERRVKQAARVPVEITHGDGPTAATLRTLAGREHADMVVMTTHARGPFVRFWLGSVTDELVRGLSAPLLLVHPKAGTADVATDVPIRHILVPLDGDELAEQILEPALDLGLLTGAEFTLLRVVRPVQPLTLPPEPGAFGDVAALLAQKVEEIHATLRHEAGAYLEKVAARVRARGLKVRCQVIVEDNPAVAILEAAGAPVDLIAMQTHGRGGLKRLLLGSVADKVIRGANVPVLVQRPRG